MSEAQDEARIENVKQVMNAAARHSWTEPDGEVSRVLVDNPRLDRHDPEYLRMSVPRKGMTFKLIEEMGEMGLKVGDVWQHDQDKDDDRLSMKFEVDEA
jgi:hypothetical protein